MRDNNLNITPEIVAEATQAKGNDFLESVYVLRELQQILGVSKFNLLISDAFGIDESEAFKDGQEDAYLRINKLLNDEHEEMKQEDLGFSEVKACLILLNDLIDTLVGDYLSEVERSK